MKSREEIMAEISDVEDKLRELEEQMANERDRDYQQDIGDEMTYQDSRRNALLWVLGLTA